MILNIIVLIGSIAMIIFAYKMLKSLFLWHLSVSAPVKLVLDSMAINPESWVRIATRHFYNPITLIECKYDGDTYHTRKYGICVLDSDYPDDKRYIHMINKEYIPINLKEEKLLYRSILNLEDRYLILEDNKKKELLLEAATKIENENI